MVIVCGITTRVGQQQRHTQADNVGAGSDAPDAEVEIYTDGACSGNPEPGGWGVLLRSGRHSKELHGGEADTTSNRMELVAVIRALECLTRLVSVRVNTDSQYVRQGMTSWIHGWKRNGWRTAEKKPVKNADLWQRLDTLAQHYPVQWNWVAGHAGNPGNERADRLARQGRDEARATLDQ